MKVDFSNIELSNEFTGSVEFEHRWPEFRQIPIESNDWNKCYVTPFGQLDAMAPNSPVEFTFENVVITDPFGNEVII